MAPPSPHRPDSSTALHGRRRPLVRAAGEALAFLGKKKALFASHEDVMERA
jgi:hypothetical protein